MVLQAEPAPHRLPAALADGPEPEPPHDRPARGEVRVRRAAATTARAARAADFRARAAARSSANDLPAELGCSSGPTQASVQRAAGGAAAGSTSDRRYRPQGLFAYVIVDSLRG